MVKNIYNILFSNLVHKKVKNFKQKMQHHTLKAGVSEEILKWHSHSLSLSAEL